MFTLAGSRYNVHSSIFFFNWSEI